MRWLAKPFLWLFTCAIPVFIAACYGAVYNDGEMDSGDHDAGSDADSDADGDVDTDGDAGDEDTDEDTSTK